MWEGGGREKSPESVVRFTIALTDVDHESIDYTQIAPKNVQVVFIRRNRVETLRKLSFKYTHLFFPWILG